MVGLAVGFIGIVVLAGPTEITGSNAELHPVGVLVILVATIFWAIGSIYSKTADLPKSSLVAVGAEMLVASVGLMVASLLSGELTGWNATMVSGRSLVGLMYLTLVGSIAGFGSYGWLLKNAPLSLVATYAYVNPIIAVILGYLLGNEALELRTGVAVGIIVGAVMLINIKIQPRVKKEALEVSLEKA
jgi:drug/metabolite transporter (DMT)-like permease